MAVYLRKDGRWIVAYRDKATGKAVTEYCGRGLEGEKTARKRNAAMGLRPYGPRTPKVETPVFTELVNAYIAARMGRFSRVSGVNFLYKMRGVILPEIGRLPASKVTPGRIDRYIIRRLARPVKKTTIHREISDIKAVLSWAKKRAYIHANPMEGYEMPRRDDDRVSPPTATEIEGIIAAAAAHLARAMALSYYFGLRPGARELFSLTWADVDLDALTLFVRSAEKGGPRARVIPIHPAVVNTMRRWRREDTEKGLGAEAHLVHFRGKPVRSVKSAFKTAKGKAGIRRRLRLYDVRHAFASMILESGADLKSVSEILGHSRPDTTVRIYQHTTVRMHRDAVAKLPEIRVDRQNVGQKK